MFKLKRKHKIQVAIFILVSLALLVLFAFLLGDLSPFQPGSIKINVAYDFAGGIGRGSHVRLSGINVGYVYDILLNETTSPAITLKTRISKDAAHFIREDSKIYINMAGIMGEKFVEIVPGSKSSPKLKSGSTIRGIDPPRIDQLISQGYSVFYEVKEIIDQIKPNLKDFMQELHQLIADLNESLKSVPSKEKKNFARDLIQLAHNFNILSKKVLSGDGEKVMADIKELIDKANRLNEENVRQFLQKEGIRAKVF